MPEETRRLLGEVHEDADELIDAVNGLIASQRSTRRVGIFLMVAALVLALAVVRFGVYAVCQTNRGNALSGPGNDRVNLFLQAYNEAAGAVHKPLSDAEKAHIIKGLDEARKHFTVIPAHASLEKQADPELLGLRDLVASLRANDNYLAASARHPVCSLWSV